MDDHICTPDCGCEKETCNCGKGDDCEVLADLREEEALDGDGDGDEEE